MTAPPAAPAASVLVVDDHATHRYVFATVLRLEGYAVWEAASGEEALALAERLPDLVVLDSRMPGLDGFEVLRRLKARPRTASIPVLQVSAALVGVTERVSALESGAAGYLASPGGDELVANVRMLLRARALERERAALLAEAEAARERLRCLVEATCQVVWTADPAGRVREASSSWQAFTGQGADEAAGAGWLDAVHPEDRAAVEVAWAEAVAREAPFEREYRLRRAAPAGWALTLGRGVPVRGADGQVREWVCASSDVTLQREQQARARRHAEFEQQLIGIVSHDLRTPLSAIFLGAARLLRTRGLPEEPRRAAERVLAAAQRAQRMIHDLLDFTQARLGEGIPVHRAAGDLHAQVAQHVEELRQAHPGRAIRHDALGSGTGEWDADRLAQVVTNLVTNALQHGAAGSPVHVRTRGLGDAVWLEVHNLGAPIPADRLDRLFTPLQPDRGPPPPAGGTRPGIGLGLYIARAIARAHGGDIGVDSATSRGTTFRVRLPRTARAEPRPGAPGRLAP